MKKFLKKQKGVMLMLIIIMGKTSSGKDTVANYLKSDYGIPDLVSYTTRDKREYETDGVEHWFISKERIAEIKAAEDLVAYTINEKTGIEYCATVQAMPAETSVYILNPDGLYWGIKEGSLKNTPYKTIYVECSEENILNRGKQRGDNADTLYKRLESERLEFDTFRDLKNYDYIIYNNSDLNSLLEQTDEVCRKMGIKRI